MNDNSDKEPIDFKKPSGVCPYHNKRDLLIEGHEQAFMKIMRRMNILSVLNAGQCIILLVLCVLVYGLLFGAQTMKNKNIPIIYPAVHATLERIK
jgi:hypothetical protein